MMQQCANDARSRAAARPGWLVTHGNLAAYAKTGLHSCRIPGFAMQHSLCCSYPLIACMCCVQDAYLQTLPSDRFTQIRLKCEELRAAAEQKRVQPDGSYAPMPGGGDWHFFVPEVRTFSSSAHMLSACAAVLSAPHLKLQSPTPTQFQSATCCCRLAVS